MKVKELIEKLQSCDPNAYVQIRNDVRWTADVHAVNRYENQTSSIVEISSFIADRFEKKPSF